MKIVYLLESTGLWGGVKSVLEAANRLQRRGHEVTVLSREPAPSWIHLDCTFATVPEFSPDVIPTVDLVIATFWTTVAPAVACGKGIPVHYCQGYEGSNPENAPYRQRIEEVYRLPEPHKVTISEHLSRTLMEHFGIRAHSVRYAIDQDVMFAAPARPASRPLRIGLVGPYDIAWKDIATGLEAVRLAHAAGLDVELVRVTNTHAFPQEKALDVPMEWHTRVPPHEMGEIYRTMDVFLGSSWGNEEGFFMPAVEAMACGVPAVLTDIPCHRGYGDEQHALFVPPRDPQGMAEAIVILSGHQDVRDELRRHGLATAALYNFDDHVDDLERVFCTIAAQGNAQSTTPAVQSEPRHTGVELSWTGTELTKLTHATAATLRCLAEAYDAAGLEGPAAAHLEAAATILPDDKGLRQKADSARSRAKSNH